MPSSNDKVGGFLTSCVLLLAVAFYVVGFEPVTCASIAGNLSAYQTVNINSLNSTQRRRTLIIRVNVTGLDDAQKLRVYQQLQIEMICNLKRSRNKPLPPNCYDATTTIASATTYGPTSAEPTSTAEGPLTTVEEGTTTSEIVMTTGQAAIPVYTVPDLPSDARRRKRNALEEDKDISPQNLQSDIHSTPNAEPSGRRRKRRNTSTEDETDCEDFKIIVGDETDTGNILEIGLFQPVGCDGTDDDSNLLEAYNKTANDTRFAAETNATILDAIRYSETTTATTAMTTTETTITADNVDSTYPTTGETTIATEILTTTANNNIVTTHYSTNPTTDNITITDTSAALNSTSPLPCLMSYKTWLPIVIVLIVLLITFIFLWRYQKGKKQRRTRPPQAESTGPPPNQAQPRPSEAENGRGPPTVPNHQPVQLYGDCRGLLIPMSEIQNK